VVHARLFAPALVATLAFASAAHAQPTDLERARTLFDEAGELERQGQWVPAQERLRAALRIRETPHLRYALGWALENSDRLVDARTEYEVALRLAQRGGGAEEVSRLAAERIVAVDHKLPLVQIRVRGALAPDTRVTVDGREIAVHGDVGTAAVDPGKRIVRVERAGKSPTEETVTMARGVFRVVEVEGDPGIAPLPGGPSEPPHRASVVPWVLIGGGGALALGGVILFVSSSSDASARDEHLSQWCDATACVGGTMATRPESAEATAFRRQAVDAADSGNTKQIAGAILGGVGIASVAVGTYLLLTQGREGATRTSKTGLRVDGAALPGGAMAGASLTF